MRSICARLLLLAAGAASLFAANTLDIHFIDVDHGNAVLLVTPSGQSMIFDSGQPGEIYLNRILAAMQQAGLKPLDYVVISHYAWDHYGTIPAREWRNRSLESVQRGAGARDASGQRAAIHLCGGIQPGWQVGGVGRRPGAG